MGPDPAACRVPSALHLDDHCPHCNFVQPLRQVGLCRIEALSGVAPYVTLALRKAELQLTSLLPLNAAAITRTQAEMSQTVRTSRWLSRKSPRHGPTMPAQGHLSGVHFLVTCHSLHANIPVLAALTGFRCMRPHLSGSKRLSSFSGRWARLLSHSTQRILEHSQEA